MIARKIPAIPLMLFVLILTIPSFCKRPSVKPYYIYPANQETLWFKNNQRWTPDSASISKIEPVIQKLIKAKYPSIQNKYAQYNRQYIGYLDSNRKCLWVNFITSSRDCDLTKDFMIKDGGDDYFEIAIDITSFNILHIYVHGLA